MYFIRGGVDEGKVNTFVCDNLRTRLELNCMNSEDLILEYYKDMADNMVNILIIIEHSTIDYRHLMGEEWLVSNSPPVTFHGSSNPGWHFHKDMDSINEIKTHPYTGLELWHICPPPGSKGVNDVCTKT